LLKMQQRQNKLELKTLDSTLDSYDDRGQVRSSSITIVHTPMRV